MKIDSNYEVSFGCVTGPSYVFFIFHDTKNVVKNSRFLVFAGDLKLFGLGKSDADCDLLQRNLGALAL